MVRLSSVAAVGMVVLLSGTTSSGRGLVPHPRGEVEPSGIHRVYPAGGVVPPGTQMSVYTPTQVSRYDRAFPACTLRWDAHVTQTFDHRMTQESAANLVTFPLSMDESGPYRWDVELQRSFGSAELSATYEVREDALVTDLDEVSVGIRSARALAVLDEDGAWWGQLTVDGASVSHDEILIVARRSGLWTGALLLGDQESASTPWFPIIGPESFPLCVDLLARGPTGDEVFLKAECAEPEVWDRSGKGCSTVLGDPAPYMWPIGAIAVLMVRRRRDHSKEER